MGNSVMAISLFLVSTWTGGGSPDLDEAISRAVNNPQRPAGDLKQDATRKPAEVLSFFQIRPGMTVLDMFSGGGYYTEILNSVVGEEGEVIAHTNEAYIPFAGEAYQKRYTDGRLAHTRTIIAEADDLQFEENSLDAVIMVLTWHDFLFADEANGWKAIDEDLLTDKLCKSLKPRGVLGIIDHVANSGGEPGEVAQKMHRIDPQVVKDHFKSSCFELEAEGDFLRNGNDDHSLSPFDPSIRGKTDRFVFRFVRK